MVTDGARTKVYLKDMGESYPHTKNQPEQSRTRGSASLISTEKTVFWPKHTRNTREHARIKIFLIDIGKTYPHTKNQIQISPIRGSASHFSTKKSVIKEKPTEYDRSCQNLFFILYKLYISSKAIGFRNCRLGLSRMGPDRGPASHISTPT